MSVTLLRAYTIYRIYMRTYRIIYVSVVCIGFVNIREHLEQNASAYSLPLRRQMEED